jgi:hypothetical protein
VTVPYSGGRPPGHGRDSQHTFAEGRTTWRRVPQCQTPCSKVFISLLSTRQPEFHAYFVACFFGATDSFARREFFRSSVKPDKLSKTRVYVEAPYTFRAPPLHLDERSCQIFLWIVMAVLSRALPTKPCPSSELIPKSGGTCDGASRRSGHEGGLNAT